MQRVDLGQPFHLVIERKKLARLGAVHLDGFALTGKLSLVDFLVALGGQVSAGTHAECGRDHSGKAGKKHIFAVAGRSAGDTGDDAEDGAQSVIHAVDSVADPRAGLLAPLVALGKKLFENCLGVDFGCAGRRRVVASNQRSKLAVVVLFIFNDVIENGD